MRVFTAFLLGLVAGLSLVLVFGASFDPIEKSSENETLLASRRKDGRMKRLRTRSRTLKDYSKDSNGSESESQNESAKKEVKKSVKTEKNDSNVSEKTPESSEENNEAVPNPAPGKSPGAIELSPDQFEEEIDFTDQNREGS